MVKKKALGDIQFSPILFLPQNLNTFFIQTLQIVRVDLLVYLYKAQALE